MFTLAFRSGSIAIRYASYHFENWSVSTPLHYENHAEKNMFQWKQKVYAIWKLERSHSDPVWWKHSITFYYKKLTSILSGRKFEEMHYLWRAERYRYICGNVYFDINFFSCLSSAKHCLRLLLLCFDGEMDGFHQSSLGNEVDFTDIMNVSLNILAKNWNFKKLKHGFVDKRAVITTALTSSCHRKTLVPFC